MYQVLHSASAMQAALEDRLPRGARVQMLDSDHGAFLAMARAGMRQATPHIQWFSLIFAEDSVRREFLAALEDNPPAAVLLTSSQWPQPDGFDAADRWPKFAALLASRYVLDRSKNENGIAWRLYLRCAPPAQIGCSPARRFLPTYRARRPKDCTDSRVSIKMKLAICSSTIK
jgi:hypothetical protein